MLSAEEKEEKKQFFRALDKLDEPDECTGSSDNGSPQPLSIPKYRDRPAAPVRSTSDATGPAENNLAIETARRKRKPSQETPQTESRHGRESGPTTAPDPFRSRRRQAEITNPTASLVRAASLPIPSSSVAMGPKLKRNFTDLSNFEARLKGEGKPKLKPPHKHDAKAKKPIDPDKQIFRDEVFCRCSFLSRSALVDMYGSLRAKQ
jgi:hypothetical protein